MIYNITPSHDVGQESRTRHPSHSYCARCGVAWPDIAEEHYIKWDEFNSMFPTCQPCWQVSTLEERLRYARNLMEYWLRCVAENKEQLDRDWELIESTIRTEGNKA